MGIEELITEAFDLASDAPELNMSNYTEFDVRRLNYSMIDIYQKLSEVMNILKDNEKTLSD